MKLSHARGATQDWRVMVERSDRMWSIGEGDGKPLHYSCLENPMNSMKRQNDRVLKEKLPRSVGFIIKYIQLFVTPWGVEHQAFLLFTISWSLLKLLSIELVINPTSSFSITHFSCPWSFPASGSFPMSWLFSSRGQSIGASASASVLLMNIQGWFPLGLTALISFQSKGISRVFSSTTVQKHQLFSTQPSLCSNSLICTWLLEKP